MLVHGDSREMFAAVRDAVATVLDLAAMYKQNKRGGGAGVVKR